MCERAAHCTSQRHVIAINYLKECKKTWITEVEIFRNGLACILEQHGRVSQIRRDGRRAESEKKAEKEKKKRVQNAKEWIKWKCKDHLGHVCLPKAKCKHEMQSRSFAERHEWKKKYSRRRAPKNAQKMCDVNRPTRTTQKKTRKRESWVPVQEAEQI